MSRILSLLLLIGFTATITSGCSKDGNNHDEALLYGKWQKEGTPTDVMEFYRKSGKNRISYNMSTSMTSPTMREDYFRVVNGKLEIGILIGSDISYMPYSTFKWVSRGRKFQVSGNERFLYLSSIQPTYTYNKIN